MRCRFQSESDFANSKCVFFIQMKQKNEYFKNVIMKKESDKENFTLI